jgi:myosin heavy subunit
VIDEASKTGHDGKYVIDFIQNVEAKFVGVSGQSEFSVAHYTGQVRYDAKEIPDKNRDFLPPEIIETLRLSDNSIVKLLFTNKLDKTGYLIISLDKDDEINKRRYKFPSEKIFNQSVLSNQENANLRPHFQSFESRSTQGTINRERIWWYPLYPLHQMRLKRRTRKF